MLHTQVLRAESFLHATVFGPVAIDVLLPERDRPIRRGIFLVQDELAGPGAPRLARVRKTGGD